MPCTDESDDLIPAVHLVKEGVIVSTTSRASDKFMHGIKVLMAKNYVDNLTEEVKKARARHVQIPSEAADWIAEGLRELTTSAEESHRHACGLLSQRRQRAQARQAVPPAVTR